MPSLWAEGATFATSGHTSRGPKPVAPKPRYGGSSVHPKEVAVEGLFGFDKGVRKWYLWVLISCQTRGGRQTVGEKTLPSSRKGEGTESAPITAQLKESENAHGERGGPLDP